jgi:hypothetical protein
MRTKKLFGKRRVVALIALWAIVTSESAAQNCGTFPDFPTLPISTTVDRDQMLCQLGYMLPTPPPRLLDPNRPPNAWPTQPANPDGANWTDASGNTINRGSLGGLWVTYDGEGGPAAAGGYGFGTGDNLATDGWQYTPIDLLKMNDGTSISTTDEWWTKRRPEMFEAIKDELYGSFPDKSEWPGVSWVLGAVTRGTANGVAYVQRALTGNIDTSSYPALRNTPRITATLRVPAAAYDAGVRVPVFISLGGTGPWQYLAPYAPGGALHTPGTHGFGICSYTPTTVQPDSGGANMSAAGASPSSGGSSGAEPAPVSSRQRAGAFRSTPRRSSTRSSRSSWRAECDSASCTAISSRESSCLLSRPRFGRGGYA